MESSVMSFVITIHHVNQTPNFVKLHENLMEPLVRPLIIKIGCLLLLNLSYNIQTNISSQITSLGLYEVHELLVLYLFVNSYKNIPYIILRKCILEIIKPSVYIYG